MTLNSFIPPTGESLLRAIVTTALLMLLFYGLFSCSPEKKLNNLLTKHPELVKPDSTIIHDTIVVPGAISDKRINIPDSTGDTVTYKDNGITISLTKLPGDSLGVYTKCPADTIYKDRIIYKYKYRDCPDQKYETKKPDRPAKEKKQRPWYEIRVPWWIKIVAILSALAFLVAMFAKLIK